MEQYTCISELPANTIAEINTYLNKNAEIAFSQEQLKAISDLSEKDPLGFLKSLKGVRGFFIHECPALNTSTLAFRPAFLMRQFKQAHPEYNYGEFEYKQMLADEQKRIDLTFIRYCLSLENTDSTWVKMVYLNSELKPLGVMSQSLVLQDDDE